MTCAECAYLSGLSADCSHEAVDEPQRSCAPSLSRDMEQMIQSSAAMTKTMLGDAEVMPGLGPVRVPLLQRQSASESRWTPTVDGADISREAAFRIVRFWRSPK